MRGPRLFSGSRMAKSYEGMAASRGTRFPHSPCTKEAVVADLTIEETELAESASRFWWLYLVTESLALGDADHPQPGHRHRLRGLDPLRLRRHRGGDQRVLRHRRLDQRMEDRPRRPRRGLHRSGDRRSSDRRAPLSLAAIVAWVLLFKGIFDIVLALISHPAHLWWWG